VASSLSPAERTLRARLAAHTLHAKGGTTTTAARAAFASKFDREVDPDGLLDPTERARRADHARKGYMSKLALKSSRSRSRRSTTKPESA
jgi:hypothetical protein